MKIFLLSLLAALILAPASWGHIGYNDLDGGGQGTTCVWDPNWAPWYCNIYPYGCTFGAFVWRGGPNDGERCA